MKPGEKPLSTTSKGYFLKNPDNKFFHIYLFMVIFADLIFFLGSNNFCNVYLWQFFCCVCFWFSSSLQAAVEARFQKKKHKPLWFTHQRGAKNGGNSLFPHLARSQLLLCHYWHFQSWKNFLIQVTSLFNYQIFLDSDFIALFRKIFASVTRWIFRVSLV